jgi:AmmeMemoRadiSam system protein B
MIVRFYRELSRRLDVRRVFIFAPDHYRQARRFVAICPADWQLSSGVLRSDRETVQILNGMKIVESRSDMFSKEHGITIHIPLIARFFPNATVVPIVFRGDIPDMALIQLRKKFAEFLRDGDLILLSMDLSHYKPPEEMAREDERTLKVLLDMASNATTGIDVDAPCATSFVLSLLKEQGVKKGELLEHSDSSEISGSRVESGTSYATIVYRLAQ